MKWYFFYTPNYQFYKNKINQKLENTKFEAKGIEIPKINMSSLNDHTHHFVNVPLKIELLINAIKENKDNVIVFTDATIYIGDKQDEMHSYFLEKMSNGEDMLFPKEHDSGLNIGVILLRCNDRVLKFWEDCLEYMHEKIKQGENVHDQGLVNDILLRKKVDYDLSSLKVSIFDRERIYVNNELPEEVKDFYYVFKITVMMDHAAASLSDPAKMSSSHTQRLTALYFARIISDDEYWHNYQDQLTW